MEVTGPLIEIAPFHNAGAAAADLPNLALAGWISAFRFEEVEDLVAVMNAGPKACPTQAAHRYQSRADCFVYLRAAQAYMLISMPTGTSTIVGVFQVIWGLQVGWRDLAPVQG